MGVEIVGCPIVRESDGLAMSSRNVYLSAKERCAALVLFRAVRAGEELVRRGEKSAAALAKAMRAIITAEPLARVDYVEVVNARDMHPLEKVEPPLLAAVAAYIGETQLIDNFIWEG